MRPEIGPKSYKYSTCVFLTMGWERFIAFTKILNADITLYSSLVTFGNSNTHIKISGQGFDFFNLVILITSTKKFGLVDGIQTMGRVHSMRHFFPYLYYFMNILWIFHFLLSLDTHIFSCLISRESFVLYFQWLNSQWILKQLLFV